ncbi:MAG: deoxyguanosinetriphosphate triphosphohydrolase [Lachnospiraceae bacterium]|nr:deoxyguanosinetriphosphate triphosphohydrolase [Lachnospiraceae bacterium]
MNIRQEREAWERKYLSPYAALSENSFGRDRFEEPDDIRPVYQRDRDRILHSKSFRRLKHKTQVFLAPLGDHYRTRLTHTLEVAQIARTITRALNLNEDLAEAIALGHDLGHTPFGHAGEMVLNEVCPEGFRHNEQSVRVVEVLEKDGRGLNLTKEVRDGMLNHSLSLMPATLEGRVVRLSDKIAYINHDIDDAIRGRIISEDEIPKEYTSVLGSSIKERLNFLIHDVIDSSIGKPDISMSAKGEAAMHGMREYMFKHVYRNSRAKDEEGKAKNMLKSLYFHFRDHPDKMPAEYCRMLEEGKYSLDRVVCDYISGMTDQFAIEIYEDLYVPRPWKVL